MPAGWSWDTGNFEYVPPAGPSWVQIIAAKISLVSRSRQYEKDPNTTTASPLWSGDAAATAVHNTNLWTGSYPHNLSVGQRLGADWGHYRYQTFESTIAFRNTLWK